VEIGIKEAITAVTTIGGWVAFFLAVRHQGLSNEKAIKSIEKRLDEKKLKIIELQKHSTKLLHADVAERKYVTKREIELLFQNIDQKMDTIIKRLEERTK